MRKALYGRRSVEASFRDFFESVTPIVESMEFERGTHEPCLYNSRSTNASSMHHIDDGRVIANTIVQVDSIIAHLSDYMLLKVSEL